MALQHMFFFMKRVPQYLVFAPSSAQNQGQRSTMNSCSHHCSSRFAHICVRDQNIRLLYNRGEQHGICKYSSHKTRNIVAKLSEEIDMDALREQRMEERRRTGTFVQVNDYVKKILAEKCDEAISNLNDEDQTTLKVIKLEHNFMFSQGYAIPSEDQMTNENWLEALCTPSKNGRLKYYIHLCRKMQRKLKDKKLPATSASEVAQSENKEFKHIEENKIMLRLYSSTIKRWANHQLCASMLYGIPLVLDMDYETHMRNQEMKNTAEQLIDMYTLNRNDEKMPFHLHLTNCPTNNAVYRTMQMRLPEDPHFLATVTSQSYLDLFDKDELIYLSPDARQVMHEFNPNAVYIVGVYNDKATQLPLSYARAKEQGIKCQRLPLDQHLSWHQGSKALTLNQVMSILMAVKNQKPWLEALKAVPTRKIKEYERKTEAKFPWFHDS